MKPREPIHTFFVIENKGNVGDVCGVQLSPSFDQQWGPNLIADRPIRQGEERQIPIDAGKYAVRVEDCKGRVVFQTAFAGIGPRDTGLDQILTFFANGGVAWSRGPG